MEHMETATPSGVTGGRAELAATQEERRLPIPGWIKAFYFLLPVVLYAPDAIFNYYVYSDGASMPNGGPFMIGATYFIWVCLSVGIVGMAYVLSVILPYHWGNGSKGKSLGCVLGILVATIATTWNSLAYRSQTFQAFPTDQWVYALWPQLQTVHFSVTMLLVGILPPFWGLFWAFVQPIETKKPAHLTVEKVEAEAANILRAARLDAARAEAAAIKRAAQVKGFATTAAAMRNQAVAVAKGQVADTSHLTEQTGQVDHAEQAEQAMMAEVTPTAKASRGGTAPKRAAKPARPATTSNVRAFPAQVFAANTPTSDDTPREGDAGEPYDLPRNADGSFAYAVGPIQRFQEQQQAQQQRRRV